MSRTLPRKEAPLLHFFYCLLLGAGAWGFARAALVAQAYFLLEPGERFPLTLEGYHQAPSYIWSYVQLGSAGLGVASWFLLWSFGSHYVSWRVVPFVLKKFLLWWGVGLAIGGLAGWAAYTGELELFLDEHLPFIWERTETSRPGQIVQTFLPPMPEDSFDALTVIAFQVGVLANALWFVLRLVFCLILNELASLWSEPTEWLEIALRGEGITFDN